MDLSLLTTSTVITFLLILFRIGGMMVSAPLFSMPSIPPQVKIGLSFAMALIFMPFHSADFVVPTNLVQFAVIGVQEVAIGILLGFAASLIFSAIQMAGEFISIQMGLSVATVLDPITHTQAPLMGQLYFYFALLVFLSLNAHHALILGIDRSFAWIPLGDFITNGGLMTERMLVMARDMFVIALLVGLPVMGLLLITEAALCFVAKVMPQMNIFMVGMPLKVGVGLLAIMLSLPYFGDFLGDQYADLVQRLLALYKGV